MGVFRFKAFDVDDCGCGMKICSDSVLLAAWFLPPYAHASSVLDVGAGSGVLALLAAQMCRAAQVSAIEIDAGAAAAAGANFASSPWARRLRLVHADFATYAFPTPPDIIISNPPYFTTGERSADAARSAARHQQGLTYASLLSAPLAEGGHLGMVTPADVADAVMFEAEMRRRKLVRQCTVRTSPSKGGSRILWDFGTAGVLPEVTTLELRDADGHYSQAYRALVEPYYLKMSDR